ncbi:MAG: hypothetical protein ACYS6I_04625 [Planctomycetota bacterium]|jgi:uncharacterized membrane protein YciS (DUF1049 family)
MMDTNQTNSKDEHTVPLAKTDWIRFGALKVQAKSRKIWQIVAIIAIIGIVLIAVTDGWLFMEREIRSEKLRHQLETLVKQNKSLTLRLSSLKSAIKKYNQLISMTASEKNQLAVEKGILQAQAELLMGQIEALEAAIKLNGSDSTEDKQPRDADAASTSQQLDPSQAPQTPQDPRPPQTSKPSQTLQIREVQKLSYAP